MNYSHYPRHLYFEGGLYGEPPDGPYNPPPPPLETFFIVQQNGFGIQLEDGSGKLLQETAP